MRIIVGGDWHIGATVGGVSMGPSIKRAAAVVMDETHSAGLYVHLGDLFHSPRPSPADYALALEILSTLGCPAVLMVGNHDEGPGNAPDALEPFRRLPPRCLGGQEVKVVSGPVAVVGFNGTKLAFFSHVNATKCVGGNPQAALDCAMDDLFDKIRDGSERVAAAFGHLDVTGVSVPKGQPQRGTMAVLPESAKCGPIPFVNGHIHQAQSVGKVVLPGSLVPTDFGDDEEPKRFLVLEV